MSEPTTADLSFDRATYAAPRASTAAPCGSCKKPLTDQYWKWQRLIVCEQCRDGLATTLAKSQSASAFGKAVLKGGGAALGCGIAYAIFVGVTEIQFALATIGIAIVIATVVRQASHGVSGRRFQVLAVALTYLASTMGYAPAIFRAATAPSHHDATTTAGIHPANAPPSASDGDATSSGSVDDAAGAKPASPPQKRVSLLQFIGAIGVLVGITLAAPFLELSESPIGAVIIAIGLWQAWQRSRGIPLAIEGPYRVAPQEAHPPAA
jgi:hypothetical protein